MLALLSIGGLFYWDDKRHCEERSFAAISYKPPEIASSKLAVSSRNDG
ncbi:hypothetical protein RBEAN4_1367 [Rickettsia bellii str. RML An4]|uniref:Uncharacterized protein n=1 Tax=Rickettsia bellii str. RML An4 TaxID=1359193 RepID=A0A0F3QFZ9_RICBE|nr:hypothetical protein RBEAN4_1367 [Rickettsia bellii str. RML An4]